MNKRLSIGVVLVVGAIWLLAPFILNLWGKTAAADRLTADLEPAFSDATISQAVKDVDTVKAFIDELEGTTIPFLASALHTTPTAVMGVLAKNFPAVGKLLGTTDNFGNTFADGKPYLNHAGNYLDTVAKSLKAQQSNFEKAKDIPASFLPTKVVAWLFFVLGAVAILLGVLGLKSSGGIAGLVTAVVGVVVIVVVFALALPAKTVALDNLTDAFRPVITHDKTELSIGNGATYLAAVGAADKQLETETVPALPGLLGLSLGDTVTALKAKSPVVSTALLEKDAANPKVSVLGGILERFGAIAAPVAKDVDDFEATDAIPGLGLPAAIAPWLLALPGLLLVIAGLGMRRKSA